MAVGFGRFAVGVSRRRAFASLLGLAICSSAHARSIDQAGPDLLDPAQRQSSREMSTDRPDKTESPYTVEAGR